MAGDKNKNGDDTYVMYAYLGICLIEWIAQRHDCNPEEPETLTSLLTHVMFPYKSNFLIITHHHSLNQYWSTMDWTLRNAIDKW
jgi:hypothetical protein